MTESTAVCEVKIAADNAREGDSDVNCVKEKKLANMRASGVHEALLLVPPRLQSPGQAIEFIKEDELVKVTPQSIRLRKRVLVVNQRPKSKERSE